MPNSALPTDPEIFGPFLLMLSRFMHELGHGLSATSMGLVALTYLRPGLSQREIVDLSGLSKFAISRACKSLLACNMIRVEIVGREKRVWLAPRGERFMQESSTAMRERIRRTRQAAIRRAAPK